MKFIGLEGLRQIILPKSNAGKPGGVSQTSTFNPSNLNITVPTYRDHVEDLFDLRQTDDSKTLIKQLMRTDPDFSASLNAYLTTANVDPIFVVYDDKGQIDEKGNELLRQVMDALFVNSDYSQGYQPARTLRAVCEDMRYMILLRGAICTELVLDKLKLPFEFRPIDISTIIFQEKLPGQYKPIQKVSGKEISLDSPTVFISYFHRDPTDVYPYSPFVAAINTVAARQAVINLLYRVMKTNGAARLTVKVVEEVIRKNMPVDIGNDPEKSKTFINTVLAGIQSQITNLREDQTFVHTDAIEPSYLDQKGGRAGAEMRITEVIQTLNDQNQAALKTMSTVIGRGDSGVNTSSVEARIFSMNADELNEPVAEVLSNALTLAIRLNGYAGKVVCWFTPVELRPDLELEPQRLIRQSRLLKDLSLGLITDNEYHLQMYNRLAPTGVPPLSGTGFMEATSKSGDIGVSPNADPLGRSVGSGGQKTARSKTVNKPTKTPAKKPANNSLVREALEMILNEDEELTEIQ